MIYDLLKPCSVVPPAKLGIAMAEDEWKALDVLMHILMPDVVVEVGTQQGGSTWVLSEHCKVVSIDHNPKYDVVDFANRKAIFLVGASPECLDTALPYIQGKRWVFFHDSTHHASHVLREISWAKERGAVAAIWHDAGMTEHTAGPGDGMPTLSPALMAKGYKAQRLQQVGDDAKGGFSGLGMCWL